MMSFIYNELRHDETYDSTMLPLYIECKALSAFNVHVLLLNYNINVASKQTHHLQSFPLNMSLAIREFKRLSLLNNFNINLTLTFTLGFISASSTSSKEY